MTFEHTAKGDDADAVEMGAIIRVENTSKNRAEIKEKIRSTLQNCPSCNSYDVTVSGGNTPTGLDTVEAEIEVNLSDDDYAEGVKNTVQSALTQWVQNNAP